MLLYPVCVVLSNLIGLEQAAKILGDMAGVYFIAVAGIVAAFFGAQAITNKKKMIYHILNYINTISSKVSEWSWQQNYGVTETVVLDINTLEVKRNDKKN